MRLERRPLIAIMLVTAICASGWAVAQEKAHEADVAQIHQATARFIEAFNSGDAKQMSQFWTAQGDFVGENGLKFTFREHLAENPAPARNENPKDKPAKDSAPPRLHLQMTVDSVRFVTPNVATVDGISILRRSGEPARHGRYTATWVRENDKGGWLIDSVRENQISNGGHHAHLMELEWMIGRWTDGGKDPRVITDVRWSADGNYLERTFTADLPGRNDKSGVQRIGWDPKRGQFRSWTFDADGSFSQGLWEETDNGWLVEIAGVTVDGRSTGSLNRLTRIDDNTITWESTEATIEGEPLPDLKFKLFRTLAK